MKKLGEGWQYTVYDLGNGRVLKKYHSFARSYWVLAKQTFPFTVDPLWAIPGFSKDMKRKALVSFDILKRHDIPSVWIGNPTFLNTFDFEQDKVVPMHDALDATDQAGQKALVDTFIIFNQALLARGVIDKSFNITKNYGIAQGGGIALIDIGELLDDPVAIKRTIEARAWEKPYVAGCIKDPATRQYFLDQMAAHFTSASTASNMAL